MTVDLQLQLVRFDQGDNLTLFYKGKPIGNWLPEEEALAFAFAWGLVQGIELAGLPRPLFGWNTETPVDPDTREPIKEELTE